MDIIPLTLMGIAPPWSTASKIHIKPIRKISKRDAHAEMLTSCTSLNISYTSSLYFMYPNTCARSSAEPPRPLTLVYGQGLEQDLSALAGFLGFHTVHFYLYFKTTDAVVLGHCNESPKQTPENCVLGSFRTEWP